MSKKIKNKLEKAEQDNPNLLKDNSASEPTDITDPTRATSEKKENKYKNQKISTGSKRKGQNLQVNKAPKLEHEREVLKNPEDFVKEALIDGYTEGRIIELYNHYYGKTPRPKISAIIMSVKKDWSKQDNSDKNGLLSKYEEMYMSIYREARLNHAYKVCVDILDNLSKLHKLYSEQDESPLRPNITYIKLAPKEEPKEEPK